MHDVKRKKKTYLAFKVEFTYSSVFPQIFESAYTLVLHRIQTRDGVNLGIGKDVSFSETVREERA